MSKFQDLTGKKFERLTVIAIEQRGCVENHYTTKYFCRCDCGKETVVNGAMLTTGHTKSCGCFRIEKSIERFTTHGMADKNRLYKIWAGMKQRCYNKKDRAYPQYGGRGITICKEWHDFQSFYDWAISHSYSDDFSIDRINHDGNYEPSNCRWTDYKTQNNNRRSNKTITLNGKTLTLRGWEESQGLGRGVISARLHNGWTEQEAVFGKY